MFELITKPFELADHVVSGGLSVYKTVKRRLEKPVYGIAAWAKTPALNMMPTGFALGGLPRTLSLPKPVYADPESCLIMVGQRGAGKSLTMGATLHRASGDTLVVFDPPGQLFAAHSESLRERGYRLFQVNLDSPLDGTLFDPMALLEGSTRYTFERDVDTLARLVVGEPEANDESAGQHFAEMSINLIAGVMAYLWLHDRERCTLVEVANILSVGGASHRRVMFERMASDASNSSVRAAVNAFEEAGDRERGSFATTLMRKLKPWTQAVAVDLCKRDAGWTWDGVFGGGEPTAFHCGRCRCPRIHRSPHPHDRGPGGGKFEPSF